MDKQKLSSQFVIRNVTIEDIKDVYKILLSNRPYVGLNSRYTYLLLAKDFYKTCVVALYKGKIVGFSSGYVPPERPDTFFNWEIVVDKNYRGFGLQKKMLLNQLKITNAKYFESTVNPSNKISKRNYEKLATLLKTKCETELLFSEEDFEKDGHEAEILCRIGPISSEAVNEAIQSIN